MRNVIYFLFRLLFGGYLLLAVCTFSGCGASKGEAQASEEQNKKKKKPKRCKMKSCHVRMMHMHEGAEMKGKRSWFLKRCFYFGKDPKYGEGLKREKRRDPSQGKRN